MYIAFVVSLLPGPPSKQNQRKEITYTNIDTFTSTFIFICNFIHDMVEENPKYGFPLKVTAKHVHLERYTALEADVSLGEKTVIEETQEMDA